MSDDVTMGPLEGLTIAELQARAMVTDQVAREARDNGDPRWEQVADQHRRITAVLVRKIKEERKARGVPEPAPIIVCLEPARLGLKSA
ncbi:MAG: hypothetical protein AB1752_13495 [Candidatus Zixiibacteriota bacterium]